ncbi:MAG: sensor histidine kinase [Telluria sp.]
MPDRRLPRFRFGPLEQRLFVIVLGAVLPLVVFSYLVLTDYAQRQRTHLIDAAQNTMRATMAAIDAELETSIASLDALAGSPRLQVDDLTGFRSEAFELLQRRGWANVVLSTPAAGQVLNLRVAPGQPLPGHLDPSTFTDVLQRPRPTIGNVVYSKILGGNYLSVKVPVFHDGKLKYILNAILPPSTVQGLIVQQPLPAGAVVVVADRQDNIVARTLDPDTWIGKPLSPSFRAVLNKNRTAGGWNITSTHEGHDVYTIWQTSRLSGWTTGIGLPVEFIDGPVQRSYWLLGVGIVLSALLGFAMAYLVAGLIVRPLQQLERAALLMGKGREPTQPDTSMPEIAQAAQALTAAWHERERHLENERVLRTQAQEAQRMAEQANEAKDEFLAMLGHELRNPLAPIYSAVQLLKMSPGDELRVRQLAVVMERQAQHLTHLVNDLLDVSRVTRRLVTLQRALLDVNLLLPDAVEQVRESVQRRGQQLDVNPSVEPAWVDADRTRLTQVIANLLQNAAKFTPDGGRITVSVDVLPGIVRITVEDTGIGIGAELLPQVFDLFKQADNGLARQQGGLGIGLSLTKGLVELHGGRIVAESEGPGRGSRFTVELPRAG